MNVITADWPAPSHVHAAVTTRDGGVSDGPYASLNLGTHVGDDATAVMENRRRVREFLQLPSEPTWLNQVHGTAIVEAGERASPPTADASFARAPGVICAVLTADCLPVILCDRQGNQVAAAHAGWRGLAAGVLTSAVNSFPTSPDNLLAWLGPAIEPNAFEVGEEVRAAFLARDPAHETAFTPNARGRWHADLYTLARRELERLGTAVFGGGFACYADADRFFSYRRDGRTGRMATMVWMT